MILEAPWPSRISFIKVEIEHDDDETPQKLGAEICRRIMKIYGVRLAEVSNVTAAEE